MAASFRQTLPADLILLIISLIDVVHEKKTLVALSRVSKHFNALTAPYLYSNFIQTEQSSRKKLLLFLRTILATPHLGRYVKTYTSESCDPRPPLVNMRDVGGPSDIVNFKKAIRNYAIHPHAPDYKWISDALAAKWDALVAILLCVLPNLHTITLQQYYSRDGYPYIEAVLKRAAAWQQSQSSTSRQRNEDGLPYRNSLSELRSVSIQNDPNNFLGRRDRDALRGLDLCSALPFLDLPSVSKVDLHKAAEFNFGQLPSLGSSTPPTSDLVPLPKLNFYAEELQLTFSTLSPESLQRFLAYFISLRRFIYEYNFDDEEWDENAGWESSPFVPSGINTALNHLRDSLQEISIIYPWSYHHLWQRPIGSLSSFKELRKLKASAGILLGAREPLMNDEKALYSFTQMREFTERLPPSLENLIIQHCDLGIIEFLSKYLEGNRVEIPPALKVIDVVLEWEAITGASEDYAGDKEALVIAQFKLAHKNASDRGILLVVREGELEYEIDLADLLKDLRPAPLSPPQDSSDQNQQ